MNLIRKAFRNLLCLITDYQVKKRTVIKNCKLQISFIVYSIFIWLIITAWVLANNGQIMVNDQFNTVLSLNVKETFVTNFSSEDFDSNYVKPEEYVNYNRVWDHSDYVTKYPMEIQVMTNMAITTNQTMSSCPENPQFVGVICDPLNNTCEKGVERPNGFQTGNCVPADFPYLKDENWYNVSACEVRGKSDFLFTGLEKWEAYKTETYKSGRPSNSRVSEIIQKTFNRFKNDAKVDKYV